MFTITSNGFIGTPTNYSYEKGHLEKSSKVDTL